MFRIGLGHDTHRLAEGSSILLGGVRIEHSRRLLGHSDADVLLHAIIDALLGAAGLGDIGEFFPDTDFVNRNRDSAEMLRVVWNTVRLQGWRIINLDTIIFAEQPKISPYKESIKNKIAQILEIAPNQVGVKAKTGEKVGMIGREEAIAAECIVLLETNLSLGKTVNGSDNKKPL
ncbi:MAG: 2-C-methyl-D-erythritol 2,4-cyclodiphosphate synthase [Planctomycetaceae bacterium]|jgi:2-C-methyl-D-erythritol 2,4-cyclodiphosphate synthase|nr:2-C-methyl-D-erythritol 2,4-cyclodiphosphate synthase [Planctomycetaceae bacterium]